MPFGSQTNPDYLDLESVKGFLQIPWNDTTRDQSLSRIIAMACAWAVNFIGRPIAPTTYTRRFDGGTGYNACFLSLPFYPVLDVVSVTEQRGTTLVTLSESTPQNPVFSLGWQCDTQQGTLRRVSGPYPFPFYPGSRNIEVTWVAGFDPLPADIWMATVQLIEYWWNNTQQISARPGQIGGGGSSDAGETGLWAGIPYRVTSLLEPYLVRGLA